MCVSVYVCVCVWDFLPYTSSPSQDKLTLFRSLVATAYNSRAVRLAVADRLKTEDELYKERAAREASLRSEEHALRVRSVCFLPQATLLLFLFLFSHPLPFFSSIFCVLFFSKQSLPARRLRRRRCALQKSFPLFLSSQHISMLTPPALLTHRRIL